MSAALLAIIEEKDRELARLRENMADLRRLNDLTTHGPWEAYFCQFFHECRSKGSCCGIAVRSVTPRPDHELKKVVADYSYDECRHPFDVADMEFIAAAHNALIDPAPTNEAA